MTSRHFRIPTRKPADCDQLAPPSIASRPRISDAVQSKPAQQVEIRSDGAQLIRDLRRFGFIPDKSSACRAFRLRQSYNGRASRIDKRGASGIKSDQQTKESAWL